MQLRPYQQRAVDQLYQWFRAGNEGHPCLVLPTGAGKSHIVAQVCKDVVQGAPESRVLMLTHVKELIEQNAEKMRQYWPNAPLGIYSAGLRRKELYEPITFGGVQSLRTKAQQIGHVDLILVDECHLISHKDEGGYRNLISELEGINPQLRVVGLTATPWRLGHGSIHQGDALFDDLIEPVTIEELIYKGFLATLRSKVTKKKLDVSGVKKRGGEFIESQLQAAVDTQDNNGGVVDEVISLAGDRKAWLFFCAGVDHSLHVRDELLKRGISAETVTGKTTSAERERIIADFKAGKLRALTNANVLTTGFDYPDIDLVAMLRPTMSPSLYVQMAGRGMRPKSHTDHCLVLDFAGVVEQHGPITAVQPPRKAGNGDAPVKVCDECDELVHLSAKVCPTCGKEFPANEPKEKDFKLRHDDIMGIDNPEMDVTAWKWEKHTSRANGKEMLKVTYYGALSDKPVTEYLTVLHDGYAGQKAMATLAEISKKSGATRLILNDIENSAGRMNLAKPPHKLEYRKDGKYFRVIRRIWDELG